MRTLKDIISYNLLAMEYTDSPIEASLFKEMMRREKFILCRDSDEPCGAGYFLYPQKVVGKYRADFIINAVDFPFNSRVWPPFLKCTIAVECDGKDYHSSAEQIEYDATRDAFFKEIGILTLRIKGSEIHRSPSLCVDFIIEKINQNLSGE